MFFLSFSCPGILLIATLCWCSRTCCIVDWGGILNKPRAQRFTFMQSIICSDVKVSYQQLTFTDSIRLIERKIWFEGCFFLCVRIRKVLNHVVIIKFWVEHNFYFIFDNPLAVSGCWVSYFHFDFEYFDSFNFIVLLKCFHMIYWLSWCLDIYLAW
jgi:hypothetical protein